MFGGSWLVQRVQGGIGSLEGAILDIVGVYHTREKYRSIAREVHSSRHRDTTVAGTRGDKTEKVEDIRG